MPKGYRQPADWDGFAMAVADAQHAEQLAAVNRDNPRQPTYDELRAEVERLRAALEQMVDVFGPFANMGAGRPAIDQARKILIRPKE